MSALMIINYGEVLDEEQLASYRAKAVEILMEKFGGKTAVFTNKTVNLGEGHGAGVHTVAIEFESVEVAQAAYESDEYQDILGQRLASTRSGFAIVVSKKD
ncbi:MAG: DUF1330 domain-containing protein [Acidimicrobiia bacterium]|nr:DUF1330 domain-containing protein [Acidimicrobiia bacterium]